MEYFKLQHIISAIGVLIVGILILSGNNKNKPLKLLSFFLVAYMLEYIEQSPHVWAVEMLLILSLINIKSIFNKDCKWYLLFFLFAFASLSYSEQPLRGIPGLFMYFLPLLYYSLASVAIRTKNDVITLFYTISKATIILFVLALPFYPHRISYPYYGMAICSIPAILYITTKKKKHIVQFVICMLPAIFWIKRTPLLGIAVGMILFSLLFYKRKAIFPILLVLTICFYLISNSSLFHEKMTGGDNTEFYDANKRHEIVDENDSFFDNILNKPVVINTNGRMTFWKIIIDKYYANSPVFGAGQGTVKAYIQSDENEYKMFFSLMHNDWLLALSETGIVGTSFLLLFFLGTIKKCVKYSSKRYPKDLRLIAASCSCSMGSTMVHMFFENCMNSFVISTSFVFVSIFTLYVREFELRGFVKFKEPKQLT